MASLTFKGPPIQTSGNLPAKSAKGPDFRLIPTDLSDVSLPAASVSDRHSPVVQKPSPALPLLPGESLPSHPVPGRVSHRAPDSTPAVFFAL